jgi:hypothetical protein
MNRRKVYFLFLYVLTLTQDGLSNNNYVRRVIPAKSIRRDVELNVMQQIHQEVKTPYKYGIILKGENNSKVDCPSVFRSGDKWYMMYIIKDIRHSKR